MSLDGREIANFVLDTCEENGRRVTNLSLQKLLYFCHVWSLVKLGRPLIRHQFEAWEYGPVLPYIYREFKEFDRGPINTRATKLDSSSGQRVIVNYSFDSETQMLLKSVVNFYSRLSAAQLVELSHISEGPWDVVFNHSGRVHPGMQISDEQIAKFYGTIPATFTVQ